MLSLFTNLVGEEYGHTKTAKAAKSKRKPGHQDSVHQTVFGSVKTTIAKDVVLVHPDYTQAFEAYTYSFQFQLGLPITQNNRPLASYFMCVTMIDPVTS
jgi:hypothetical protein